MWSKFFKLFLLLQFCWFCASAKCTCNLGAYLYHNGIATQHANNSQATSQQYIFMIPGDSIRLYGFASGGTCVYEEFTVYYNGEIIFPGSTQPVGNSITVYDEGTYRLELKCDINLAYAFIATSDPSDTGSVNQFPPIDTSGHTLSDYFGISPAVSAGIFSIVHTGHPLKRIQVSDAMGRIVFTFNSPVSEINLRDHSAGIYFYRMEDQNGKYVDGKIIKQ